MDILWSLLSLRRKYHFYARIDQSGICQAFKRCRQAPAGNGWVEIVEENCSWLGRPLPAGARLHSAPRQSAPRELLSI
jgi:hypothetical protein